MRFQLPPGANEPLFRLARLEIDRRIILKAFPAVGLTRMYQARFWLYALPLVHVFLLAAVAFAGYFRRDRRLLYVLPLFHICCCLATWVVDGPWMPVILSELPVGALLLGGTWQFDYPLFWFGVLGTLWWYLLGRVLLVEIIWRSGGRYRGQRLSS